MEIPQITKKYPEYHISDGTKVKGVTTILGNIGWGKNALMYWAWKEGKEGRDYKETSKEACDIGNVAHYLCECHIKGIIPNTTSIPKDMLLQAENSYDSFRKFLDTNKLSIIDTEIGIVSEKLKYGGTIDCIARDPNGKLHLIDIKTSNGMYATYLLQLAAYGALYIEKYKKSIRDYHIIRISKQGGMFFHYCYSSEKLAIPYKAFLAALRLDVCNSAMKGMI
ncbi:MAG: hypothetical protein EPN85_09725 [Bacteroidetes bacterium]|nr:MAG: hypothetical protein EPN85_09725 [Bacteroidota bacterium]